MLPHSLSTHHLPTLAPAGSWDTQWALSSSSSSLSFREGSGLWQHSSTCHQHLPPDVYNMTLVPLSEGLIAVNNHHVSPRRRGKPHNKRQTLEKLWGKNCAKMNIRKHQYLKGKKTSQSLASPPKWSYLEHTITPKTSCSETIRAEIVCIKSAVFVKRSLNKTRLTMFQSSGITGG